jgi:hypothetical protein|tara:strand:- start:145 stop:543 length:399 start_codon:yes stop_codon:yes gene_type:complete
MEVYNKDMLLKKIQCQIKKNKKNLMKDFRELEEAKTNNEFLKEVYEDYGKYKNYIVGLKKDQEIQILSLLHYLEKSMLEANLTERMVLEARNEEKILLNKLSNIRGELKEITENVEEVVKDNLIEDNLVDEK